ncbi:MAG: Bax inhibitor-1/YccA family protein [Ketobacteraceae bacterium]|nr:Bax inhibitor-1/YccA family protein [Ketobacteraceae bacterium]
MQNNPYAAPQTRPVQDVQAVNKVLRNTYLLLGMTLAFSAVTCGIAMATNVGPMNIFVLLIGFYGLLFGIHKTQNSPMGLVLTFALTGFMGFTLGPIFNTLLAIPGGGQVIMLALGGTAVTFFTLSAYALISKKDFSFLSGFLVVGFVVLVVGMIANYFLQLPMLSLAMSAGFILFSSAAILMQTGAIINGGERNYVLATVTLYVSIYNIFMSLLHILMAFSGDD